jgi:hypothetical protein
LKIKPYLVSAFYFSITLFNLRLPFRSMSPQVCTFPIYIFQSNTIYIVLMACLDYYFYLSLSLKYILSSSSLIKNYFIHEKSRKLRIYIQRALYYDFQCVDLDLNIYGCTAWNFCSNENYAPWDPNARFQMRKRVGIMMSHLSLVDVLVSDEKNDSSYVCRW